MATEVQLLYALDIQQSTWYANAYCGARYIQGVNGCPQPPNANWYSRDYVCFEATTGASPGTNCYETMTYFGYSCYVIGDHYSDCANFVSQIYQAGCGGLCQSQPDLFPWCGENEDVYFFTGYCDPWNCGSHTREVAQSCDGQWWDLLSFSGWWTMTGISYPPDPFICDAFEGDLVIWDWTNNGTWDHVMYLNNDVVQYCGDEFLRGHSTDRCSCNQLRVNQVWSGREDCDADGQADDECTTYAVWRWIGNPSCDPIYGLSRP